jgi:hypothetical protein
MGEFLETPTALSKKVLSAGGATWKISWNFQGYLSIFEKLSRSQCLSEKNRRDHPRTPPLMNFWTQWQNET